MSRVTTTQVITPILPHALSCAPPQTSRNLWSLRLSLTCMALVGCGAQKGIKVALYVGAGTAPTSAGNMSDIFTSLQSKGVITKLVTLQGPDVATLAFPAFDVVVFPELKIHPLKDRS